MLHAPKDLGGGGHKKHRNFDQLNVLTLKMYFTYINSSMKADFS